jgi:hypothetical protein
VSISAGYALVPAACPGQQEWMLHALTSLCLVFALGSTALAWAESRRQDGEDALSLIAAGTGAFFSLVIATQWATRLLLDPCTR